jgi:hypothetical protein
MRPHHLQCRDRHWPVVYPVGGIGEARFERGNDWGRKAHGRPRMAETCAARGATLAELARSYNVSQATISRLAA